MDREEVPAKIQTQILDLMIKSRVLEERLIKIYKAGESFFWVGGPGEEAWGVPLGLLVHRGEGLNYDYLHFHYRCTSTVVALGLSIKDSIRMMMNRSTDPNTGGRNFCNHYCRREWNLTPVSSPIETQYLFAIGTAIAQRDQWNQEDRRNRTSIRPLTIVTGGDAGTAEGDFASCLVWASRPGQELPLLITVQNNGWGIATAYGTQHGETHIADRGSPFGIRSRVINGNDPLESYLAIQEEMNWIRETGRPSLIEAKVSRLYGHSSADGANRTEGVPDPVMIYQEELIQKGRISSAEVREIWEGYEEEALRAQQEVRLEPAPGPESIWDYLYSSSFTSGSESRSASKPISSPDLGSKPASGSRPALGPRPVSGPGLEKVFL